MSFWQKFFASFFSVRAAKKATTLRSVDCFDVTVLDKESIRAFKFGFLQSSGVLAQLWKPFLTRELKGKRLSSLASLSPLQLIVPTANSSLERQAIQKTIREISLRPVELLTRAVFLNQYLLRAKKYSALKLIIDVAGDFTEVSLFLNEELIKSQTFNWGTGDLEGHLSGALELFLADLPAKILAENWQYYYLFLTDESEKSLKVSQSFFDRLNKQLQLEGVIKKGPLTTYV